MRRFGLHVVIRLLFCMLLLAIILAPRPASAHTTTPVILGAFAWVFGGSLVVNEAIMLACQKRPLTWQEVPHALIPVYSQLQVAQGCKKGVRR